MLGTSWSISKTANEGGQRPFILPFDAITPKTQKPLPESIVFEIFLEWGLYRGKGTRAIFGARGKTALYCDYLYTYTNRENPKNAKHIVEYLASKGIEASPKTIYNDILRLQIDFGVPVEYNPSKWGYYITQPEFEPYELRLMVDSIQSSKFITQEKAREITNKIKKMADVYTKDLLNRQAFVTGRVRSLNESVVRDADRIYEAIALDRKIAFRYFHYTPNKDNPKSYTKSGDRHIVSPYALLWSDGNFYLYSYDGKKFRTYRVDRMENISAPLLDKREGKNEYDKKDIIPQQVKVFNMYHGTAHYVRMRVHNRMADAVIDQFGKDIMMIPADEGHFTVNVPVELSPPFYAWVATFGRSIKILSPEPAVKGMKDFLQKSFEMYQDD